MHSHFKKVLLIKFHSGVVLDLAPAVIALHGVHNFRKAIARGLDAKIDFQIVRD